MSIRLTHQWVIGRLLSECRSVPAQQRPLWSVPQGSGTNDLGRSSEYRSLHVLVGSGRRLLGWVLLTHKRLMIAVAGMDNIEVDTATSAGTSPLCLYHLSDAALHRNLSRSSSEMARCELTQMAGDVKIEIETLLRGRAAKRTAVCTLLVQGEVWRLCSLC